MENEGVKNYMIKMEEADFQSRAKFLIDTTDLWFRRWIKDLDSKELTDMEKHWSVGWFNKMIKNYESSTKYLRIIKMLQQKQRLKIKNNKSSDRYYFALDYSILMNDKYKIRI